ncbi:stage II sporulation protein M [Syntrophomonas palmitatica]|uniref:stage II sporulation protein M n=1 Tax=Syntrophomonas palmitatica TaxID=402877 RepID=UPI0006CF3E83|nr:stage II sporulation protein M [Syntrophomonas palmitatica]
MKLKTRIKQHLKENRVQYFIVLFFFIAGIFCGDYRTADLDGGVRLHLLKLIEDYLKGGIHGSTGGSGILWAAYLSQVKTLLAVWFLGLTVIGLPLILTVILLRGFSLGFTWSFLIHEQAQKGIAIGVLSILPQNLVYIPLLLVWSVAALNFSVFIIRNRNANLLSLWRGVIAYTMLMFVFSGILLIGSFIEAYLSPWLLSLVLS